jgi:hypothetical protein
MRGVAMSPSELIQFREFRLFAHGESFDVDAFLAMTTLHAKHVWRRGEQCVNGPPRTTSGITIVLHDGQPLSLPAQEEVAVEYLRAHRDQLRALTEFPGVEVFVLGLQYDIELDASLVGFHITPSPQLMWHALDVGVEVTYYVMLDRHKDSMYMNPLNL